MSENIENPLHYGFYNASYGANGYDRLYSATEMSKLFNGLILDGVFLSGREGDTLNKQFLTSALDSPAMYVKVAPGRAWIKGHYVVSDSENLIAISSAGVLSRIDALVIELDTTGNSYDPGPVYTERCASFKIIEGVPSEHPEKPEIDPEEGIYQYPIAYITVDDGVTAIENSDIEYTIGVDTPYFAWLGENLDISENYSKWETILGNITEPFETWFESMKRMLGWGDQAYYKIKGELETVREDPTVMGIYPKVDEMSFSAVGDGVTKSFDLSSLNLNVLADILIDGEMVYDYTFDNNIVTFKNAPLNGSSISFNYVPKNYANEYTLYFGEV